jgi:hypothetical protein
MGLMLLPWETADETKSILSDPLMEKVMSLSVVEGNFTTPCSQEEFSLVSFEMNKSVPIILKLLEIDKNLARMHAKLSPKMDEEVFWRNYFLRVKYLRAAIGIDGPDLQASLGRLPEEEVLSLAAVPSKPPAKVAAPAPIVAAAANEDGDEADSDSDSVLPKKDTAEKEKEEAEAEAKAMLLDAERRRAEAARLEAEVLAELSEDLAEEGRGSSDAGSTPGEYTIYMLYMFIYVGVYVGVCYVCYIYCNML